MEDSQKLDNYILSKYTKEDIKVYDPRVTAGEQTMAKNISEELMKHYPDHAWGVFVDAQTGMAKIFNLAVSDQWGFYVRMVDIKSDYSNIASYGGEILERYKLTRGRLKEDEFMNLAVDLRGDAIHDE